MIPMSLRVVLVPENGAGIEPPEAWLAAAREGMVVRAEYDADAGSIHERLDALEQRQTEIEAGTNIVVTPDGEGVLRIHAVGGGASYRTVTESGENGAFLDNGSVLNSVTGAAYGTDGYVGINALRIFFNSGDITRGRIVLRGCPSL